MVSAMPQWSTPISFISRTTRSTSSALTSPWYGQPSAHETAPRTLMPCRVRGGDDRAEALDALGDRAVDVLLAEGLGRRGEDDDLVGPLARGAESAASSPFMFGISTE